MGGDFAVGQSRFWIYFVVVVPLTWLREFSVMAERRGWNWPYRIGILK